MSRETATPAGRIVEEHLDHHLEAIQHQFNSDALLFIGPLYIGAEGIIRDAVEFIVSGGKPTRAKSFKKRPKLSVILETPGGLWRSG
jgi:hypothetical protein